jgi:hypothetical protein
MPKLKLWSKLIDVLDDILAYLLTIVGILSSTYIPMLKTGEPIDIRVNSGRLIVSAIVALLIIAKQERITGEDTAKARAGRRANFASRMLNALAQGVMWVQIMQLA